MTAAPARLYGDHSVTRDALVQIASPHGFEVAEPDAQPAANGVANLLVMAKVEAGQIGPWLSKPIQGFIEIIDGTEAISSEVLAAIGHKQLFFSLATNTAYNIDSAALICDALEARGVLSPIRRPDVELSLHETISNAVVHGNLELESNRKGDISHFATFAQTLLQRMSSPEAARRVNIMIHWDSEFLDISVLDQGRGYDESKLPVNADPFAPAGRGLAIIRSLTLAMNVTHGGRMTTLRFLT